MITVFRKELRALLTAPQAWAIATAYLIISGLFFVTLLFSYPFGNLERYFTNIETTLIVVAPILAMRSFAEERRTGALDITLSWPVSRWYLVLGKFLSNTVFVFLLSSIAWLYVLIIDGLGTIDVGTAAAGFLGILMLAAMFNAIALAISARSASPTTAVFVGFGVLLGLWILDFVPGWIGGGRTVGQVLEFLAPTTHIENSGRGILDLGDALYFLTGVAAGLTLAGMALREPAARRLRAFFQGRNAALLAGVAIVVASAATSATAQSQLDLTPELSFTLTRQSQQVLAGLHEPVHITGFVQNGTAQQVQMRSLVRRYILESDLVDLEFVDPDKQPSRLKEIGGATQLGGATYGEMVVEVGGRKELVRDIFEIDLTSAIGRVARTTHPLACFTVGHGERTHDDLRPIGYSRLGEELNHLGYRTAPLALAAPGGQERLESCAVVIVAGPRTPFLGEELTMLQVFAENQGRLLVLADRAAQAVTSNLNALIAPWGLTIEPSLITDQSSLINDRGSVLAFRYPTRSLVTAELKRFGIPLLLVSPQPVASTLVQAGAGDDRPHLTALVTSSGRSTSGKDVGPFVLAAVTDTSRLGRAADDTLVLARTRIGVVGNAEMASNLFIRQFGNLSFMGRLVSWVAQEDDIVAASRTPPSANKLALTEDDRNSTIRSAIVLPGAVAFLLFLAALYRLRRG